MKTGALALAVGTMLTVEQRDTNRSNLDHSSAAISADGRFVAFTTRSGLVSADVDGWSDVYVLDRTRQHVTLESADTDGYIGDTSRPGISGDGRYVVFERAHVVMLRDRLDGVTRIIGEGNQPFITENGRVLLFTAGEVDSVADIDANGASSPFRSMLMRRAPAAAASTRTPHNGRHGCLPRRRAKSWARSQPADLS